MFLVWFDSLFHPADDYAIIQIIGATIHALLVFLRVAPQKVIMDYRLTSIFLALYPYTENVIIILTNTNSICNSRWLTHVAIIQLLSDFKASSLLDSLFADVKTCNVIYYRYNSSLSCKDTLLPKISLIMISILCYVCSLAVVST